MSQDDFDELETLRRRHAERAVGWIMLAWTLVATGLIGWVIVQVVA